MLCQGSLAQDAVQQNETRAVFFTKKLKISRESYGVPAIYSCKRHLVRERKMCCLLIILFAIFLLCFSFVSGKISLPLSHFPF